MILVDCGNGQEINPLYASNTNVAPCINCERGYYRDGSDRTMTTCQMCPVDYITAQSQTATTSADCTIRKSCIWELNTIANKRF